MVCEYCGTHNVVPRELWEHEEVEPEVQDQLEAIASQVDRPAVPVQPKTRSSIPIFAILGVVVALAGAALPLYMVMSRGQDSPLASSSVGGLTGRYATTEDVVPSLEAADGFKTAQRLHRSVQKNWRKDARMTTFHLFKVSQDGLMDLRNEDASLMSMYAHDVSRFGDIIPGETKVKGAELLMSVQAGNIGIVEGDASTHGLEDVVYVDHWPRCSPGDIWKSATEAGYPDRGFADMSYPEVPGDVTRDGIDFALSFVRKGGKKLKKKLESIDEWDTTPYHYISFYIPNFDVGDLPRYFHPDTCKPVDPEAVQKQIIEDLRNM